MHRSCSRSVTLALGILAAFLPATAESATSFLPDEAEFSILHEFVSSSGGSPYAGLVQGADGALYGTTTVGGSFTYGTVFKVNPDGTDFTVLKNFDYSFTGGFPFAELLQGADGALYGSNYVGGSFGGGTVFKLNTDGTGFMVLANLDIPTTGGEPFAALVQGVDGAIYGSTYQGGSADYGTVFKLDTDGSDFTVLHNFDYIAGGFPSGKLVQDAGGVLYGMTLGGGMNDTGTVFKLNSDGTGFTILWSGWNNTNGSNPTGGLVQGADGTLYGTTSGGGSDGVGTVFRLDPDGSDFGVLQHLYLESTGGYPSAGLVLGMDGALYGTTSVNGGVFKVKTDGTGFVRLQHFLDNPATGGTANGRLMQGDDRALYGTTFEGGAFDLGAIYRLALPDAAPTADAGLDFSVNEGQPVELAGLGNDTDGDALSYAWEQLPGGTSVTLMGASTADPTFTAPAVNIGGETLSFMLTVTANGKSAMDTVSVSIVNVNHSPVADAGLDQSVAEGSPVSLHGEDSFDVDNDPTRFTWVQVSGSPTVVLSDPTAEQPAFTAPFVGMSGAPGVVATLVFELQVDDDYPADAPAPGYAFENAVDRVTVEITNLDNAPVAAAGGDQTVDENTLVELNGTASSDPDSDTLTHEWAQVGGPAASLVDPFSATPSFTAPFISAGGGDLTFELTVDDGYGGTATDTVVVHVQNINDPPLASAAHPSVDLLAKPNHGLVLVAILGVSDPDSNATITITGVTQDEPTNGQGDGDTAIDAIINTDGTVLLRAERSKQGDGRVYHIHFTAADAEGSVSGVVTVSVPLNPKKGPAIDGGELYSSTN